jgi:SAM-dependent methyltransferase
MDSLSKIAHRRLYPPITDPSYLVLRSRRLQFTSWAGELRGKRLTVLDIGGRYQPYRPLLKDKDIERYIAVDLVQTEFVNLIADAQALPLADETFDVAIATQVFEYFQDPCEGAREIYRILKPGGVMLSSFAACTPRFVDEEKWRFMAGGLRQLMAPFEKVEIVPELHSLSGLIRTLNLGLDTFVRYDSARRIYRSTACPVLNVLGFILEKAKLTSNDRFTPNYSVRAIKQGKHD